MCKFMRKKGFIKLKKIVVVQMAFKEIIKF
jgi:hypothetical protein